MKKCQNDGWRSCAPVKVNTRELCERYLKNPITKAIVFGGLEPFEQFDEMAWVIKVLRINYRCNDDIVIYTGFYPDEIDEQVKLLSEYENIIIKFGRFVPDRPRQTDDVLGVELASDNQYAIKIS